MPVSDETLRILAAQRQALGRLLNGRGDDLVALWVRAWDEVSGEVEQAITAMMRAAAAGTPTWTQAQRFRRASKTDGRQSEAPTAGGTPTSHHRSRSWLDGSYAVTPHTMHSHSSASP